MKKCHYHAINKQESWCSFEPKTAGFHFLRYEYKSYIEWLVWDGNVFIGNIEVHGPNKYAPSYNCFDVIKVTTPVYFSTLRDCAKWMTKHSRVSKHNREELKQAKKQKSELRKKNAQFAKNKKQILDLAKNLGVNVVVENALEE